LNAVANSGLLRLSQIVNQPAKGSRPAHAGIVPVSAATWWQWVKAGKAPAAIKLSPGVTVWRESDVRALIDQAAANADHAKGAA
jgi:predicted DNA-binding transcriptional regulator AlpA